jgi:hypothetical protein
LGESNDSPPEVQVEIRAAEIAAGLADGGCMVSMLERCGFNGIDAPMRGGGTIALDTESTRAGYLAHAIATHPEEP